MQKMIAAVVSLTLASFAGSVFAHEGHTHEAGNTVMGTVSAVHKDMNHIVVKTKEGKKVGVTVDDKTKYLRGNETATFGDVTVGTRVVISVTGDGDNQTATEVRLPERASQDATTEKPAASQQH